MRARFFWQRSLALLPLLSLGSGAIARAQTPPPAPSPAIVLGQMNGNPVFCFPDRAATAEMPAQAGYCIAVLPFPDGNTANTDMQLWVNLQIPQTASRVSVPMPAATGAVPIRRMQSTPAVPRIAPQPSFGGTASPSESAADPNLNAAPSPNRPQPSELEPLW